MPTLSPPRRVCARSFVWLFVVLFGLFSTATRAADSAQIGERLYQAKCARCHGAKGEGTKKFKQPLAGKRSSAQLADLIGKTMPEDNPGALSPAEVQAVSAYTFQAFYSKPGAAQGAGVRIELARLTVNQYRQSAADLLGSFRWTPTWGDKRGLRGEYFKSRHFSKEDRVLERLDPEVNFDFGTDGPVPEAKDALEFSIRWNGAVLVPETGSYEVIIRTEHAARLWLNDQRQPLIDAWVKSGTDTEYKATCFLVAGRMYPLRMEYTKAKQGVDDSKKNKKPPAVKSSMALLWKAPGRVTEPIPARSLAPISAPEAFVVATPFPPDDRSYGWERGTTVSKAWDQAATDAALVVADTVAARVNDLAGTKDGAVDRPQKIQAFCKTFAERAFRRPLSDDLVKTFIEKQLTSAPDPETGVKRVVLRVLKSPRFLYREVGGESDGYDVAARLSFGLWDSLPDQELRNAAASGRLATKDQVAQQATRMLADPRAKAKVRSFLLSWLKADGAPDLLKDPKTFPGFDAAMITDLRTSLELFLDDVVWSDGSDFRQLLLSDSTYLNARLARYYGIEPVPAAGWTKVKLDGARRAGVLSHPYLLTNLAHSTDTSPILRGVFLARGVLGVGLRPPPEAVTPLPPELHPNLTTRERVMLQTKSAACMTCHDIINPLGFTFEHFDAVGRYRQTDHNKPIDSTGFYRTRDGRTITVHDVNELATFVAGNEEAHTAFTEQLFHHLVQQSVQAYGPNTLDELRHSFAAHKFSIKALVVEVLATAALKSRSPAVANRR